ncbi:chemotaxis protein : MCP methyltransferase, CheR-type OS=Pirellula staleyi (strain ATCC 27377 / DSM 6068 / ICPB 4128) GN=Psta_3069 PE=4 SV=1: CheR_N: CheR [Gemmata massiliana]|uniref:protein-glutamate O-methyltransferase n=1 Tax=Gemmata massiliana TaxID=1210884 RepID=A0A6P2D3P3_9BACT|nr:protein-glutamate O-methyltransferase CheR [Gemmata massiliana]VTR95769.1 chemotaxis protein : MCP methyltransferase, CheR-type OS=Pirellula staleyi (strain ATCC 27377 / DSM 6068 / ICPB 4128) GN=Psta_3069 PE=4 SV=1: CheR_N: CheR [Gemmata massiliana]
MTPEEFDHVCKFVRDRSSIVLEPGKEYLVETRLTPVAREFQLKSVSAVIAQLRGSHVDLQTRVVEAMVTTETLFFRDREPFESIRTTVLPDLIRRRANERQLNVWSAACSTGQEPYSFVMLIRQHFPELADWKISVLATDLSEEVLAKARAGRYNQVEINRGLPAPLLVRYFKQIGTVWQLTDDVRQAVEFRAMNLTKPWPMLPRMDLVFLRNVMIYFDVDTKKAILQRMARVLRPDGYLLLGGAETTLNLDTSFQRVESIKGGFHQFAKQVSR